MNAAMVSAWRSRRLYAVLLALLAGALQPLAFAPFHFFPLAVLCPALLFWLWQPLPAHAKGARRAFLLGYVYGLGLFGVGVSWVYVAIHDFGFASVALAVALTAVFVGGLALFPALLGYLGIRLLQRVRRGSAQTTGLSATMAPELLVFWPAAWTLFEWLRGWVLTGFPWLDLGYSQIDAPLAGWAPVLGIYGVSWATALSAGLVVYGLQLSGHRRGLALAGLFALWLAGWGLFQVSWTRPLGEPIQVSLIQGDQPQETKWDPRSLAQRLAVYGRLTREHWDSRLIVWPENAMTDFYSRLAPGFLDPLATEARAHNATIILGIPVEDPRTGRYYAAMVSIGAGQDEHPGLYRKRHLVPFGEYVPLERWLRGAIAFFNLPMSAFSPGPAHQPLLHGAGQPLATTLCYEDAFTGELLPDLPRATLLVNGSNNAWYGDSFAPFQHLQISRMRALETGRELARVTTSGITALVDDHGRLLATSAQFRTDVLTGKLQPRTGATPYVLWGLWPVLAGLWLASAGGLWWVRRRVGKASSARN